MKFKQIRSATSIVTFGSKRFLIDPMLAQQGAYPEVPFTTSTGRGTIPGALSLILRGGCKRSARRRPG